MDLNACAYEYAEHPVWLQSPLLARRLSPALAAQLADPAWRAQVLADGQALAQNRRALQLNQQNLRTLYRAGVKIGFGTDSGAAALRIHGIAEHHRSRPVRGFLGGGRRSQPQYRHARSD